VNKKIVKLFQNDAVKVLSIKYERESVEVPVKETDTKYYKQFRPGDIETITIVAERLVHDRIGGIL